MMFSPDELTAIRETAAAALPEAVTLKRLTRTVDAAGGYSETLSVIAATVGRVAREKPREVTQGDKITVLAEWIVTLPFGTDVRPGDVIHTSGQTLKVVGLFTGSWRSVERALCVA